MSEQKHPLTKFYNLYFAKLPNKIAIIEHNIFGTFFLFLFFWGGENRPGQISVKRPQILVQFSDQHGKRANEEWHQAKPEEALSGT